MHWRTLLGATLLILQGGAIVRARFVDDRYFCWAPFDRQTRYSIAASVNGRPLTPAEIRARYKGLRVVAIVEARTKRMVFNALTDEESVLDFSLLLWTCKWTGVEDEAAVARGGFDYIINCTRPDDLPAELKVSEELPMMRFLIEKKVKKPKKTARE